MFYEDCRRFECDIHDVAYRSKVLDGRGDVDERHIQIDTDLVAMSPHRDNAGRQVYSWQNNSSCLRGVGGTGYCNMTGLA